MQAVEFRKSIPRYLALRALGPHFRGLYTSGFSPVVLRDLPVPALPTPSWVRVRPTLAGICGSDLATICAKGSAYLSPLTSTPFILGHEVVGIVVETGDSAEGVSPGDRVVLQPALGCLVRGIDPACDRCRAGELALCRNVTRGDIAAGIQTGYCHDTGGAWSEAFVAHHTQLFRVPEAMDDEVAVLVEPFACSLHGVLRADVDYEPTSTKQTVLVLGCGTIGLLTIAALRFLGGTARVVALAKYPHQRDHALALGADEVVMHTGDTAERYRRLSDVLGCDCYQPEIGKPTVIGGADITFDCIGGSVSIDDACRFTRSGGEMILVGMPAIPRGVDWTAIWFKELSVRAAYAYGTETVAGTRRATFDLAIELLGRHGAQVRSLVGEPFALSDYRSAVRAALSVGRTGGVKTVLRIESRRD